MKWLVCVAVGVFCGAATQMVAEEANPPEIVASLFPASGLIPVDKHDHPVYRFGVIAQELDDAGKIKMKGDAIVAKVMEDTLVEPGQTRTISSPQNREWRLEGAVDVGVDGFVRYHVTLLHNGERVTSTSAGMRLENRE